MASPAPIDEVANGGRDVYHNEAYYDDIPGQPSNGAVTNGTATKSLQHSTPIMDSSPEQRVNFLHDKVAPAAESSYGALVKVDKTKTEAAKDGPQPVPTLALFKFADVRDKALMVFGSLCAICHGVVVAVWLLVFGGVTDEFIDIEKKCGNYSNAYSATSTPTPCPSIVDAIGRYSLYFLGLGLACWLCGYGHVTFWVIAAERQCQRMKQRFLHCILYQDMSWFDHQSPGELSSRLADDITKIQKGIGDKLSLSIMWFCVTLSCFIIGFTKGWKLSLVILSLSPLLALAAYVQSKVFELISSRETAAYAKAGAVAEEVLASIRTVAAFGGEEKEVSRYRANLKDALRAGVRRGALSGIGMGFLMFVIFGAEALGFWYGSKLVREDLIDCCQDCLASLFHITNVSCVSVANNYTSTPNAYKEFAQYCPCDHVEYSPGVMVTVFFSILFGAYSLGQVFPNLADLFTARGAARYFFDLCDRVSLIDASKDDGLKSTADSFGQIQFDNVHFKYATRPDVPVLQGLTFSVKPGETVALVGASGCGKSTSIQLLQRFYDSDSGQIRLGGQDIRNLNVAWLRSQIGVVSQQPVLFDRTITDNIRMGRLDSTQKEIEQAARDANAHGFISSLPQGYDTVVGEGGSQLSGGQKQRIAIARALIRNPAIMLLDEATSALDTESEKLVQEALDKAMQGRTTIIIAHRLTTVQNADKIFVLSEGSVVESGTHDSLYKKQGMYYALVQAQQRSESPDEPVEDQPSSVIDSSDPQLAAVRRRTLSATSTTSPRPERSNVNPLARAQSAMSARSALSEAVEEKPKAIEAPISRIARMNAPEWFFILLGCCSALVNGAVQPVSAIVFADVLNIFILPFDQQEERAVFYAGMFLVIGFSSALFLSMQSFMFALSGERLTKRLRQRAFQAMLRQEIGWFDNPQQSTGVLTTRLATDASSVQGATGARLGSTLMGFGSLGIGFCLAMSFSWKLTLVILSLVPLLVLAGFAEMRVMVGFAAAAKEGLVASGKVAAEAIDGFRTVVSLGRERMFFDSFVEKSRVPYKKEVRKAHLYGMVYGFSQSIQFGTYAIAFYYGAVLINKNELDFNGVMRVFGCIVFSAMSLGQAVSFAPDYTKAKVAAAEIFALLDRKPLIDATSTEGVTLPSVNGRIDFTDVQFAYPNRDMVQVLQKLNLAIKPGQRVALVGASGCGKSTCIQLLERFYDPLSGRVTMEGTELTKLNIGWLRKQFGLVSQEPVLFDRTIAENIAYGDNSRKVSMEEIIEAARKANIHSFIAGLPQGYDTPLGSKGNQISGGQKQRLAIARALVRDPKILLLDEATSALDSESEKVVQEALDQAQKGRTCIIIAHRLSTIQDADNIVVLGSGAVVEQGTHKELMLARNAYYALQMAQQTKEN